MELSVKQNLQFQPNTSSEEEKEEKKKKNKKKQQRKKKERRKASQFFFCKTLSASLLLSITITAMGRSLVKGSPTGCESVTVCD